MKVNEAGIKKQLGQRVREQRLKAGISQEKLAELTGLHRTYISDIECGTRNVAIINIVRIAEALATQPSELVKGIEG
ncbi:MAG: helix-turn-helix transcriptional regulator [Verrucomicrobia bacterium]|jgi:transcriptional regulator with XRE-family HTH domain|nr:helix-turn-helix transcriptional regulator [Verrucomicrobiota bacterium]MBT7067472.1 helix-turn-helix transcriptional regulator [Verrucomicrobiota bacterium]